MVDPTVIPPAPDPVGPGLVAEAADLGPLADRLLANADLLNALRRAQAAGWIGGGDLRPPVEHALRFGRHVPADARMVVDLGSGGGLPGLVLAVAVPTVQFVLVDAAIERADHLRRAVRALGLPNVEVEHARAEVLAVGPRRGTADAVLARSLARPWCTVEWGVPLLRAGGVLVVSARTEDPWPAERLAEVGAAPAVLHDGFAVVRSSTGPRSGIPRRRPLPW